MQQISAFEIHLEIRDITTRPDWLQAYQYEIPVLFYAPESAVRSSNHDTSVDTRGDHSMSSDTTADSAFASSSLIPVERASPRASVSQVERLIGRAIAKAGSAE